MGPLKGFRIIEIAGIGPGPYCGMLLSDMGAEVLRIERPGASEGWTIPERYDLMNRGRRRLVLDLKTAEGRERVLRLCETADALFEGNRPGAMERLGLGPDDCMVRNPALVYGRITGWGQEGPLSRRAGHDANFISLTGVMQLLGEKGGGPLYPPMLAGDFGGGGAYLAIGILAALLERSRSGRGQVVDAAIMDGTLSSLTTFFGMIAGGIWSEEKGSNLLDGAAPFVAAYRTRDGGHIFVSPLENRFFRIMLERLGIHDLDADRQYDEAYWPVIRARLRDVFLQRNRNEWAALLESEDCCCTPVLGFSEVEQHPHAAARGSLVEIDGIKQPAPAPRFSRTPSEIRHGPGGEASAGETFSAWESGRKDDPG